MRVVYPILINPDAEKNFGQSIRQYGQCKIGATSVHARCSCTGLAPPPLQKSLLNLVTTRYLKIPETGSLPAIGALVLNQEVADDADVVLAQPERSSKRDISPKQKSLFDLKNTFLGTNFMLYLKRLSAEDGSSAYLFFENLVPQARSLLVNKCGNGF